MRWLLESGSQGCSWGTYRLKFISLTQEILLWSLSFSFWVLDLFTEVLTLLSVLQWIIQRNLVWAWMKHIWGSYIQQKIIECKPLWQCSVVALVRGWEWCLSFSIMRDLCCFRGRLLSVGGLPVRKELKNPWMFLTLIWNDCRFGYLSNTKIKFILVTTDQDVRDADVRNVS